MRPPILILCLLCILALFLSGCATTQQTMPPAAGELTIHVGTPDSQTMASGPFVVVVGCQIGLTAKPVGLDILNPATSAAAAMNSPNAAPQSGPATIDKPPNDPATRNLSTEREKPDTPDGKGDGDATGQAAESASQEEQPADSGGG